MYSKWIHRGESVDTKVVDYLDEEVDGFDHGEGIDVDVSYDNHDEDDGVPEVIGDLYAATEADGEEPRFAKVLADVTQSLSPGSSHSKFSFLVRLLYIKSHYRISSTTFTAIMKLSSSFPQCKFLKSYVEVKKYLHELGL